RGTSTFDEAQARLAARNLLLDGGFNANSTSREAWIAVLSGLKSSQFNGETGLEGPFVRSTNQPNGSTDATDYTKANAWLGFRNLTPAQIATLADSIVQQIKTRGPAVSFGDFVNRRLILSSDAGAAAGVSGRLQAAIDASGVNSTLAATVKSNSATVADQLTKPKELTSTPTGGYLDIAHLAPNSLEGMAGLLTQGDLLQALAPVLTARSDTFRIRTYGEVINPVTQSQTGRAWCEAIVQRLPDYVNATADNASVTVDTLTDTGNKTLGRRFQVISFRWLNPDDI
ncbi:MAG: hypothetical protein H7Y06_08725, partial [Opitutaceae bacterium]|nr:hypothetical protein [Opitutaceae bacterium]